MLLVFAIETNGLVTILFPNWKHRALYGLQFHGYDDVQRTMKYRTGQNRSGPMQILVAYIIAIPITWLLMQHWLEQFAYRISATQWNSDDVCY